MMDLNQKMSVLSNSKRELLLKRLSGVVQITSEIVPVFSKGQKALSDIPLSDAQHRKWMIHQMDPFNPWFNTYAMFDIKGTLNEAFMRNSIREVMNRHVILRVVYKLKEGKVIQEESFPSLDAYYQFVEGVPHDTVYEFAKSEVSKPFNMVTGPLVKFILVKQTEDHYWLIIHMHHIISDGWSIGVLFHELIEYYSASLNNTSVSLPALDIQYPDYSYWQNQLIENGKMENELNFWREKLNGNLSLLEIPSDYPRPPVQRFIGHKIASNLDEELIKQLRAIGSNQNASLFMVILAAFKVLLHRYSGEQDIVIGTPVANRNRKELEALIGCFVNTLVLRTSLNDDSTYTEVLESVKATVLEAFEHKDYPFERIVELIAPKRDVSYTPIFQVMFILNESSISNQQRRIMEDKTQNTNMVITSLELSNGTSKYDMTLNLEKRMDRWVCSLEYSTDLFSEETATRMLDNLKTLLEGIIAQPTSRIRELPIMTQQEKIKITKEWNQTQRAVLDKTIDQLFDEQALISSDSVAITDQNESMTYEELRQYSNRLAATLSTEGVKRDSKVGIYMERSIDLIATLLAVFKVGATYVPLDPKYPSDRNFYVLDNSNASVVITDHAHSESDFMKAISNSVFKVDRNEVCLTNEKEMEKAKSEDLAYVLYTSGSTGKPKGVKVTHRSVVNLLLSFKDIPGISPDDVFASVTSYSFDISVLEYFLPLVSGATLAIVPASATMDGSELKRYIGKVKASIMQATPSLWRVLVDAGWSKENTPLKALCGGEALTAELARSMLLNGSELWNVYGPTETTVWSTVSKIENTDHCITIGRPISNTKVYILDAYRQPVPIGVTGEIYIGGMGVSEGYLDLPQLTDERFTPSPFLDDDQTLLYSTGDIGRFLSDGSIEHLGRSDSQIKLRGHRVELGEIESALNEIDIVRQSLVTIVELDGDMKIVAYMVWSDELSDAVDNVKRQLKRTLPEYMIPSYFMSIEDIPLLPNGKVNKNLLPKFSLGHVALPSIYEAPQTLTERRLSEIWSEILGIENVGINDNFFDLGGHSLLAIKMVAQINEEFQVYIQVISLFTTEGTLKDLALRIDNREVPFDMKGGGLEGDIAELHKLLNE